MNRRNLAEKLEAVAVAPDASSADVHRMVALAMQHQLAAVCVSPVWAQRAAVMVRQQPVPLCVTVGFPHGTSKSTMKAIEATAAAKDGADEIEVVPHLPALAKQDVQAVRTELLEIVRAVRATGRDVLVRVVLEAGRLMSLGADEGEGAIAAACQAARESGCDMIVTATGYGRVADDAQALGIIRRHAHGLPIKYGRARSAAVAQEILPAADRVGVDEASVLEALISS